jgi:hypothetical protein
MATLREQTQITNSFAQSSIPSRGAVPAKIWHKAKKVLGLTSMKRTPFFSGRVRFEESAFATTAVRAFGISPPRDQLIWPSAKLAR